MREDLTEVNGGNGAGTEKNIFFEVGFGGIFLENGGASRMARQRNRPYEHSGLKVEPPGMSSAL